MFDAFGDESCGPKFVSYGLVCIPQNRRSDAEQIASAVKEDFGGSPSSRLHCRELFSGQNRQKSAWKDLFIDDVFSLYKKLFTRLKEVECRRIAAFGRISDFPESLPSGKMKHVDPLADTPSVPFKGMPLTPKHLAAFCAKGAVIALAKAPGLENVLFRAHTDRSKIAWFDGRKTASGAIDGFFVDLGPQTLPVQLKMVQVDQMDRAFLDVADAIAFVTQRRKSDAGKTNPNAKRFRGLYSAISPEEIRFGIAPDGGFGFLVPNR